MQQSPAAGEEGPCPLIRWGCRSLEQLEPAPNTIVPERSKGDRVVPRPEAFDGKDGRPTHSNLRLSYRRGPRREEAYGLDGGAMVRTSPQGKAGLCLLDPGRFIAAMFTFCPSKIA